MKKSMILCLDDEKIILDSLKMQLRNALSNEYLLEFSQNGEEGLEILDEYSDDGIDVVVIVSDWLMPGMRGDEFLVKVHKRFPKTLKILLTGQADQSAIKNAYDKGGLATVIRKPWEKEELISAIQEGLQAIH